MSAKPFTIEDVDGLIEEMAWCIKRDTDFKPNPHDARLITFLRDQWVAKLTAEGKEVPHDR